MAKGAAYLLQTYTGKLILDADGLNILAKYKKEELCFLFKQKKTIATIVFFVFHILYFKQSVNFFSA